MELSEIQIKQRDDVRAWGTKLLTGFPTRAKVGLAEVTLPRAGNYTFVGFNAESDSDPSEFVTATERFFAENEIFMEVKNAFGLSDSEEEFISESGDELVIVTPKSAIKVLGFKSPADALPFRLGPAATLCGPFEPSS